MRTSRSAAAVPDGRWWGIFCMRSLTVALSKLTDEDVSRIVEMAWEDRTAFEAIEVQFGLNESAVVSLMRLQMKPSSFRMWRKRMAGRVTKHAAMRSVEVLRHRASHTRQ